MEIPVILENGFLATINSQDLDLWLEKQWIVGFRRSSGWVMAGQDELRSKRCGKAGSWRNRKNQEVLRMSPVAEEQGGAEVRFELAVPGHQE